jgi:hypothetical protein
MTGTMHWDFGQLTQVVRQSLYKYERQYEKVTNEETCKGDRFEAEVNRQARRGGIEILAVGGTG